MTTERQRKVILVDSGAVVANADQFGAALLDIDLDAISTGIQTVFL